MAQFIPKRVFVKKECHLAPRTKHYLDNIKKLNPSVEIQYLNNNFAYPKNLSVKDKYEYAKETVIIGERSEYFIRTFPSPGDIVEYFETVVNPSWMCPFRCEFCYLQTNQAPEHFLYTNFYDLERELETASYAHTAILTVWSMLSFAKKESFLRIPLKLREVSDWLREHFLSARINSDQKAINSLFGKQKIIYNQVGAKEDNIGKKDFIVERDRIEYLYNQNKIYPLWLNTSEFLDVMAVEHITGNLEHLIKLLPKFNELRLRTRTRSCNLDVLTKDDLFNRVEVVIDLEPQSIIDKYAHGTSPIEERISAIEKLQHKKDLILRLAMEPVFYYKNWEKEYKELIDQLFTKVKPSTINRLSIGFPRYRPQLKSMIIKHFPQTSLFHNEQDLQKPESTLDARLRYTYERREEMFNKLKELLSPYNLQNIDLGAENHKLWEMVKLDKLKPIQNSVYQYINSNNGSHSPIDPETIEEKEVHSINNEKGEKVIQSLEYNAAYEFIQNEEEEIDDEKFKKAESYLNEVISFDEEGVDELKWTRMYSLRISEAMNGSYTWKPIKLVGYLNLVGEPAPLEIQDEDVSLIHITITDLDGNNLDCLRIPYKNIQSYIERIRSSRQLFSVLGAIVSVNTSKRKSKNVYRFYVKQLSEIVTAEDMITYRPQKLEERVVWDTYKHTATDKKRKIFIDEPYSRAVDIIQEAKKTGVHSNAIIQYLKSVFTDKYKIKSLDTSAKQLNMAIEFAILQALSQHRDEYSYKLHSLLIGPPNVGKGFIPRIAKILSPIYDEIPSNSPKITSAGLVARVQTGAKKNMSVPGVFPRTSGGTVAFQDFHEISKKKRRELFAIFTKMMEDGEVLDKTSGNTLYEAVVGLHIDTNRYSQVYRNQVFNSFQDLDIPINILSRFDFIMEIPKDSERQKETSEAMAEAKTLGKRVNSIPDWVREIKMLIAFLRSRFEFVRIPDDVAQHMKDKLKNATIPYAGNNKFEDLYEDMQNRVSFSLQKMVRAISCANMELTAKKEYVDYAFQFIDEKLKFLSTIDPTEDEIATHLDANDQDQRQKYLAKEFYDKEFTAKEVVALVKEKLKGDVSERTIKRDFDDIGATLIDKKKGIWSLKSGKTSK